ncbi:MAG: putative Ig domain-containing protein [bacterium]
MRKIKLMTLAFLTFLAVSCSEDCKFNSIVTDALPDGTAGTEYYYKIELETSCSAPFRSFEITDGNLPKGITLETSGELMGIPTEKDTTTFKIKVRVCFSSNGFDWVDCTDKTKEFTLIIN